MNTPALLAGLGEYKPLAQEILTASKTLSTLEIEEKTFPDGEVYHRLVTDTRGKHIILLCGTHNDAHFMALMDVACACAKLGAQSLTLLIPYLGYSTMERATMHGEVVKAKVRARMLSSIPQAREGNKILFLDLHADGIPHYLEGNTQGFHLYSEGLMTHTIQNMVNMQEDRKICIGSTDAGRSKWVQSLARRLGVRAVTAQKTRHSGTDVSLDHIESKFNGETVVIYDDMIRTGGSLLQAARGYREKGASRILALTTHGVLPQSSLQTILEKTYEGKPLIEQVVCTDSIPSSKTAKDNLPKDLQSRFHVVSTLPIWLDALHTHL